MAIAWIDGMKQRFDDGGKDFNMDQERATADDTAILPEALAAEGIVIE